MKLLRLMVAAVCFAGPFSCGEESEFVPPRAVTPQEQSLVTSSNAFGFDFFAQVVSETPEDNVFVSPLSVSMALGMTYNGARGDTATGMASALAYGDMELEEVNESYASLIALLTRMDPEVTLEIANAVWFRQGLSLLADFVTACETYFEAVVEAVDFSSPSAVDTINAWVAEKTHGKIDKILDTLNSIDMMVLTNAIYFQGDWTTGFDRDETTTQTFHGAHGDTQVPMMHTSHDLAIAYTKTDTYQAARLPYGHELFAMTILLPAEGSTVDDLVAQLDSDSWQQLQASMGEHETPLLLPRFELEYESRLNDALSALGMHEAFDRYSADFSGMTEDFPLYIDRVLHKTYVKVDEKGTEAAAATAVVMARGTTAHEEMRVDRPFVVVIHDMHSQSMLFMGRVLEL